MSLLHNESFPAHRAGLDSLIFSGSVFGKGVKIPWINTGDLNDAELADCGKRITELALSEHSSLKVYPAGSLAIAMYGATIGKLGLTSSPAAVNQACCVFTGKSPIEVKFLFYWFLGLRQQLLSLATGGGQPNVSQDVLRTLRVAAPCKMEQANVVSFLDRETAKIDALVAEQERLIELLKEKRQAIISHAVTKGLNPNAPLKPSGIPWLGDVPDHWVVAPVNSRFTVQLGKMLDAGKITGQHLRPYLRVFDVQWGAINTDDLPQMDFDAKSREKFLLATDDLLVNEGGSYPGRSAIWKGQLTECYFQKALHRLRPRRSSEDSPHYFYYVMYWASNFGVFVAGGNESTIEHLPAEKLRRYRFAFPPLAEQRAIALYLEENVAQLDSLTTQAQSTIELLQERRTALISAAVTGKIDVRGLRETEAA